jgi:hypothetical protein
VLCSSICDRMQSFGWHFARTMPSFRRDRGKALVVTSSYISFVSTLQKFRSLQLSLETDAAGAELLLDMLPCFILLTSLHIDISNTTHPSTLQHLCRILTVAPPSPPVFLSFKNPPFLCSIKTFKFSHAWSSGVVMIVW